MASWFPELETDLSCPICQDIFKYPVVLTCSHSFCKDCLQMWWADKLIFQCPVCKRRSSKRNPPNNLALRNLCEAFLQKCSLEQKASAKSEDLCSQHSEKLRLFCLDHQQPVCVVCRDSKIHTDHRFRPIEEAAQDFKEELRESMKPLEEKLERLNDIKVKWDHTAVEIKAQAQHTEKQITEEFVRLQYFLQKEGEARITVLKKEEEQKSRMLKQRTEALNKEIAALSDTIRATKEELKTGNVSFLQKYQAAAQRVQQHPLPEDPRLGPGALIDVSKHLGNLTFKIWNKIKMMVTYYPVILDPNTANPNLILSENLISVRCAATEQTRQLSRNPERFEDCATVLGCEGFNSGTHRWEAEVRTGSDWAVGVMGESVPRRGEIVTGCWAIRFRDGKYSTHSPPAPDKAVCVMRPLKRIRVHLDWNRGTLSFSDPITDTDIHTFSQTFTERLYPFISTKNTLPLRISGEKVTVQLEDDG